MADAHAPAHDHPVTGDRSISLERANTLVLALIPPIAVVVFAPLLLAGGADVVAQGWRDLARPLLFIPALLLVIVVHEGLHALGFLLGGAPRESIHFGIHRPTLSPYAGCRLPLETARYRLAVALPALVLGVLPWLAGIALGIGGLVVFAFWMLLFAGGDLLILWLLRDLPPHVLVLDHPTRAGCTIVSRGESALPGADATG